MMMKKFLPIVLLLTLLCIVLTACGGDSAITTADPTTTTTTVTSTVVETSAPPTTTETPAASGTPIKLLTFNLRYDTTSHPCMSTDVRGAHLMEVIDKYQPDSVGFNEATNNWMNYLRDAMKERGYDYIGLGRDSGVDSPTQTGNGNEHCPVFYRTDKFELIDSGNFWMSNTPAAKGTHAWNSACKRICSYVVLKNKETGEVYAHLGTHLDHVSVEAQVHSVSVIETYIRAILEKHGNIGIVLTGDFNCVRFDKTNPDYIPTTYNSVTAYMDDALDLAKTVGVQGASFSGYQNPVNWENGQASNNDKPAVDTTSSPIDYIFLKKGAYTVSYYTVVDDTFTFEYEGKTWHNHPISDHYGIYCEATLSNATVGFTKDDSKLIAHQATVSTDKPADLPEKLSDISLSSSLLCSAKDPIDHLLLDDESVATATVNGTKHGYWEITATFSDLANVQAISFKTASTRLPYNARVFVSHDQSTWEQVGAAYDSELSANTTYYFILEKAVTARYVKLIFSDCVSGVKLENFSLYGSAIDTGKIYNEDIVLLEGPKSGEKEGYEKMFDGKLDTKFYIRLYENNATPADPDPVPDIVFATKTVTHIQSYQLTNASDTASFPGRLAREWTLYASLDGNTFTVIDHVIAPELTSENFKTFTFEVDAPGDYQYYKLVFDTVGTTGNVQFSEIVFFEKVR
ncbi:MAG: hypothetical protein IJW46_03685 [Clostridia bacterium]|nr:hypothetical protein [Clostridia bacterium]